MARINYTPAQQSKIVAVGKQAGLGSAFVPQDGFNTHFTSVTTYKTSTSPAHQVIELSYNNILVQEAGAASALALKYGCDYRNHTHICLPQEGLQHKCIKRPSFR